MELILGIDPGSRFTGYGIIAVNKNKFDYITSGVINISKYDLPNRLKNIFLELNNILANHKVSQAAIESVFVSHNPNSALKLGQARGAALTAIAMHDVEIFEYAPRLIKKSITGSGAADKSQMQIMIRHLLKLKFMPKEDEADALAVALCHNYRNSVLLA